MRPGVTLPELVLVAWLFALVLLGLARFAAHQGQLTATTHDRVRAADLVRTADLVLNGELRHLGIGDVRIGSDSVRLRAVRGTGVICGADNAEVRVRYRGLRTPNPSKDSALVVSHATTGGRVFAIEGVRSDDGCGSHRLRLDPEPPAAGLVMVFETGAYHLSGGALRYRRGRGGRQPVTEAVLADAGFERRTGGVVARLPLGRDSLPRQPARTMTARVRFLNGGGS